MSVEEDVNYNVKTTEDGVYQVEKIPKGTLVIQCQKDDYVSKSITVKTSNYNSPVGGIVGWAYGGSVLRCTNNDVMLMMNRDIKFDQIVGYIDDNCTVYGNAGSAAIYVQ